MLRFGIGCGVLLINDHTVNACGGESLGYGGGWDYTKFRTYPVGWICELFLKFHFQPPFHVAETCVRGSAVFT